MNDRFAELENGKRPSILIEMCGDKVKFPGKHSIGGRNTKPENKASEGLPIPQMVPVTTWDKNWQPVTVWVEKFNV